MLLYPGMQLYMLPLGIQERKMTSRDFFKKQVGGTGTTELSIC